MGFAPASRWAHNTIEEREMQPIIPAAAFVAALAFSPLASAQYLGTPTEARASVGVINWTIEDLTPNDGIDAGVSIDYVSGYYWGMFIQRSNPSWWSDFATVVEGGCAYPCSQWGTTEVYGGILATAFTRPLIEGSDLTSVDLADVRVHDLWTLRLEPNTRAVFEIEGAADATGSGPFDSAAALAELSLGTQSFSDSVSSGSKLFRFEVSTGGAVEFGTLFRRADADAALGPDVTAVPEPGTYALLAMGLAALAWYRRRSTASPNHA
jgi:hypothetical protein